MLNLGHDSSVFGITSSDDLIKNFKSKDGQAVLFKKFDDKRADFDADFEVFLQGGIEKGSMYVWRVPVDHANVHALTMFRHGFYNSMVFAHT